MSNVVVYDVLGREVSIGDTVVIPQKSELKAYRVSAVDPDTNRIGCAYQYNGGKISLSYTWRDFIKVDLKIKKIDVLRKHNDNFSLNTIDFF